MKVWAITSSLIKYWDFSDLNFVVFFFSMIFLGALLIFVTIFFLIGFYSDRHFKEKVNYESTTTRIYIIDVKNNRIIQFNKSDIENKITTDLFSFYSSFHPNDVERVKTWIFQICIDPGEAGEYLEADTLVSPNNKKVHFSLLRLLEYNKEKGLIHLESHILKYISPINAPKRKNDYRTPTGIVKRSQIMQLINRNKSLSGFSYCIRFFCTKQKMISNDKIERYMVMNLKNAIYTYAGNSKLPRQIVDNGDNEIFLFDLRISNKDTAMQLATSISHSIKKQIEVNGFSGYINFAIGVVENRQFYQDFDAIEEKARDACMSGQNRAVEIVLFKRNSEENNDNVRANYTKQINHLLKDGVMRLLFRPIINVKNSEVVGYFEYVKAYDSPFSSFSEMSKYAAKVQLNQELFATVCKNLIPKFAMERQSNNYRLFLNVSMVDINNIHEIISHIPRSNEIDIVLVFDELEINENSSNVELLISTLQTLKNNRYHLALSLKDKNLLLDDKVYFLFHYFVVGSAMMEEVKHNNRIRLSVYALIESLMKYSRPIIATDLEGWQAVELIIKSGITYISSDAVAPSNDMLLPVEKKKMEKVTAMAEKYL